MNNLKVGKKFLIVFGSIIVCTTLALIVTISGLVNTANRYTYFYTKNYLVVSRIADMGMELQAGAKSLALATMETTDAGIDRAIVDATSHYTLYDESRAWINDNYEGDKTFFNEVGNKLASIQQKMQQIIELSKQNTEEAKQQAQIMLVETFNPEVLEAVDSLQNFTDQVKTQVDTNYESAMKLRTAFLVIAIVMSVIAVLVAVILALDLTKRIINPIREVQEAMANIAEGKMEFSQPHLQGRAGYASGKRQKNGQLPYPGSPGRGVHFVRFWRWQFPGDFSDWKGQICRYFLRASGVHGQPAG